MSATTQQQPARTGPSALLYNILVTFLCPLFLGAPARNNDVEIARAAAIQTLRSFDLRTDWDLIVAVQIVCFGVAALGSIGLSMDDELPVNTVLRCRYNANALQRSSDRSRDRMEKREARALVENPHGFAPLDEDAVLAAMRTAAKAQHHAAEARARFAGEPVQEMPLMRELREGTGGAETFAPPTAASQVASTHATRTEAASTSAPMQPLATQISASAPSPAAPAAAAAQAQPAHVTGGNPPRVEARDGSERDPVAAARRREIEGNVIWAGAMAAVATELAEELPHLSPDEQRKHQIRISALSSVAEQLSSGKPAPSDGVSPFPGIVWPPIRDHGRDPAQPHKP